MENCTPVMPLIPMGVEFGTTICIVAIALSYHCVGDWPGELGVGKGEQIASIDYIEAVIALIGR